MPTPIVIAEFCQNHNGDPEVLQEMVALAAQNGATYGKIQAIYADNLVFRPQFEVDLLGQQGKKLCIKRPFQEEYNRLKGLELDPAEIARFVESCRNNSLKSMITVFAREQVPILAKMGFDAVKVASYDCASYQLLRELKEEFQNIFVSTGATFDDEIAHAAAVLQGTQVSFLHCVTIYPTPIEELNLARMRFLRKFGKTVGFSDHSLVSRDGLIASKAALALGANVIERHFTILDPKDTKDGQVSIGPRKLKELTDFGQLSVEKRVEHMSLTNPEWKKMIGTESRPLSTTELLNRDYYRGRFASRRKETVQGRPMIDNWEEVQLRG